ncbi:mycothiol synthase [cyanobacterium TDX16]|nr:mycothiol synthase [cyanobacterium TDX16]
MLPPTLRTELAAEDVDAIERLLSRIHANQPDRDPDPPVRPDHDDRAGASGFAAAMVRRPSDPSELAAYAQAVRSGAGGWAMTLLVDPADRTDLLAIGAAAVHPVLAAVGEHGGGPVRWWVRGSNDEDLLLAERLGFDLDRELVQLRVPLPLLPVTSSEGDEHEDAEDAPAPAPVTTDLVVRPFTPDDEDRWLEVNNAAFAGHPDQSGWTRDELAARRKERWYDPAGFLVHEGDDGQIDGFCWTKVHEEPERLGEIYVIGVHPDAAGQGLGRSLVVAGLQHLAEQGLTTGMLWTEHDNEVARHLYEDGLGFHLHHADRLHTAEVAATD